MVYLADQENNVEKDIIIIWIHLLIKSHGVNKKNVLSL